MRETWPGRCRRGPGPGGRTNLVDIGRRLFLVRPGALLSPVCAPHCPPGPGEGCGPRRQEGQAEEDMWGSAAAVNGR